MLRQGIRLVEAGDYTAAIAVLEAAALEFEASRASPGDMARSYFYAGVARVFVVGDDEARFAFYEAQQHDPEFRPSEDAFPRRVIRLWEEAHTMDMEAEAAALGEATATLTVITEPVAATVYVAGRPRGETPVEVAGLPVGDHRVTIVKEGYINNSRVMALAPNQAERLNVELTASAGGGGSAARAATELQESSGSGGGWWKWAALAGGGAVATWALLPKNEPPVADAYVRPTGAGMAGLTNYRFDGGGSSDPDNDGLTYSWNFGDGSSGSGVNTSHVYDSPGTYSITLTVSDGKEQATTTTGPVMVTRDLDGGAFRPSGTFTISGTSFRFTKTIRLTQNGRTLGGSAVFTGDATGSIGVNGDINSSSNDFVCPCDIRLSGSDGYSFSGTVANGAGSLTGDFSLVLSTTEESFRVTWRRVTFTRQ